MRLCGIPALYPGVGDGLRTGQGWREGRSTHWSWCLGCVGEEQALANPKHRHPLPSSLPVWGDSSAEDSSQRGKFTEANIWAVQKMAFEWEGKEKNKSWAEVFCSLLGRGSILQVPCPSIPTTPLAMTAFPCSYAWLHDGICHGIPPALGTNYLREDKIAGLFFFPATAVAV